MNKFLITFLIITGFAFASYSQCNYTLIDSCKKDIGANTYLRHFKIRFKKAKRKSKISNANFSVYLTKGNVYQITTRNDSIQEGIAVVKLYDDFRYYIGNLDNKTNKIRKSFAFSCKKTGIYYITAHFDEGKEGCAVIMLSLREKEKNKYSWD